MATFLITTNPTTKITDISNLAQGINIENGCIRVQDYLQAIAEGDVSGHTRFEKLGFNASVDNTEEDLIVQGGLYVWPATAQQMDVLSSSTSDASAGTGIKTLTIYYLDASFVEKTVDVTMNGVTAVPTSVSDIFRINHIHAKTVGTGNKAAGNISVHEHGGTTNTYGYIEAGYTIQRQCVFTVPVAKTLYITSWVVSGVNGSVGHWARFTLRATYDELSNAMLPANFFLARSEVLVVDQSLERDFRLPIRLPAGTDIKVSAISDAGASHEVTACALRGWFE